MNDILLKALEIVVMVAVIVISNYLVPWLKTVISEEKLAAFAGWVEDAVLCVQQTMQASTGEEKKAAVVDFLQELLAKENISVTDVQLDVLIEAAVKQMKIEENSGIVIETAAEVETEEQA